MSGSSSARRRSRSAAARESDPYDHDVPAPAAPTSLLTVGAADHPAEAEADAAADRALSRLDRLRPGGDDDRAGHDHVRRTASPDRSAEIGVDGGDLEVDTEVRIRGLRGRGRPLPDPVRRQMEQAFETPLDRVRVHSGAESSDLNHRVSARAFTVGQDIFLGGDQLTSGSAQDRHVLAHEIAHTLQGSSTARRSAADSLPIRRYALVRADDGGSFVGDKAACHCHIDVGKPHFKVGKDDGSRINFGRDMSLPRLQRAYEALLAQHHGKSGYDDCKEYLEEQGCVEPEEGSLIDTLKGMLVKWGGLGTQTFSYYVASGDREEIDAHSPDLLDGEIEAYEAEIRQSDALYDEFLDDGAFTSEQFADLDEDAMAEESNKLFNKDRKAARK